MKKLKLGILAIITFFSFSISVKAASLNIYASTTSVTTGSSVIITIKASDMAGQFSITSSNANVLSGGTSSTWIDNGSQTFTFKTNGTGSATVTVKPIDVADYEGNPYGTSKSVTITVTEKKAVVLSSDNNLTSLSIDGVTLSPEFNKDTLEYSVELEPDTTSININAKAAVGASITGAGTREVTDGDNRLEVIVTAENGTTKTYVINAVVKEHNPIEVVVDDKKYTVVRKKALLSMPNNYEETTVKINEEEVPAFKGLVTNYILVGLKDTEGNINLFIYDETSKKYTLYKEYSFNKVILYPMELKDSDIPKGYSKSKITYNDEEVIAYKLNENSKYALIYGLNVETGKTNIYMYDSVEDTLQIYNTEEINKLTKENEKYLKLLIAITVVAGLLFISLFIAINKLLKYKSVKKIIDKDKMIKNETKKEKLKPEKVKKEKKIKQKKKKDNEGMASLDDDEISFTKIK